MSGEGFSPSPVLTGEGRDEGELERFGHAINKRLHCSTLSVHFECITDSQRVDLLSNSSGGGTIEPWLRYE